MQTKELSDADLLLLLHSFVGVERGAMGKVLAYLGEVDARGLYADKSCSSMFEFCVHRLRFSEDQACRRIAVARLARQFPSVLEAITDGRLNLTSAQRLQPFLADANVDELIAQASGKTRSELDVLIARLAPKSDVPESISVVPEQRGLTALGNTSGPVASPTAAVAQVKPLSEASYCITLTVPAEVHDMLQEVRTMMRHRNATGDVASIFARGLELLHEDLLKQTRGATKRPRRSKGSVDPGYVTAATRREVHARDGSQCTFVSAEGERCPSRDFLELDHIHPRALGGTGDAENVRLRCRTHNRHAAEQVFGREHVQTMIRASNAKARAPKTQEPALHAVDARVTEAVSGTTVHRPTEPPAHPRRRGRERHEESASSEGPSKRESVRFALVKDLHFKEKEAERVLAQMPVTTWARPVAAIVLEAIGLLR